MPEIYCPQCGNLIPEGQTVCPGCGFDLAEYDEEAQEEFNELLNAANKKLSEESEDSEDGGNDGNSVNNGGEQPAAKDAAISQNQLDALMGGQVVDLTETEPAKPAKPEKPAKKVKKAKKQPEAEAPAAEPEAPEMAEMAETPEKTENAGKEQTAQKEKKKVKRSIPSFIITVLAVVVAAALGFCVAALMFTDFIRPAEEQFAVTAANAVNSRLNVNEKLFIYKAYVKQGSASDEAILYAVVDYGDAVTVTRYRVVVNRADTSVINIYYPVDETSQAYIDMKNSDDPEVRIQASVLKNYSDTIENAHKEILMGSQSWKKIDVTKINGNITSRQTRKTGFSEGTQPASAAEDGDIPDLED